MKAPGTLRPAKESTFLDDPSLYPEYAALTTKLPTCHAFRRGLHTHRTAALVLMVAVCVALSGVPAPALGGTAAAADEWLDFFFRAMAIDRLVDHFEGLRSGFFAMGVVALISIVVYPLHSLATRMSTGTAATSSTAGGGGHSFGVYVVTVGVPSAAVWIFAVWAQTRCAWALVPGLWFALYCACVTLKITAFVASASSSAAASAARMASGASASPPDGGGGTGAADVAPLSLTFGEYLFFLFLSPSLVCEMHLMKVSVRRKSRPLRAASEFFHAGLTFLCAHCIVGSLLAPAMRLFFAGLCPTCEWVKAAGPEWAALEAAGGAGWPSWTAWSAMLMPDVDGGDDATDGGLGRLTVTLACFLWMIVPVCSAIHFLVFYAFWHCVCLGMAELWGFPDRNLYGCWWLLFDEPRDFLRMWSVPVHRWLSACVHWPMLELTRGGSGSTETAAVAGDAGNGRDSGAASDKRGNPPTSPPLSPTEASSPTPTPSKWTRSWLTAVLATFFVSGVFHEAIVYVAMRGTCWPFNTFLLCVTGMLIICWDHLFPVLRPPPGNCAGSRTAKAVKVVRPYGDRGALSVVVLNVSVQMSAFICDCAAWLWWRHIHMKN